MERSKSLLNQDSKTIFRQLFSEYLSRSQVQGYKLILQTDRPFGEKALWLVIALFGVVLTSLLVTYSYFEFLESPTVTSEDPIRTSVLDLGFPAVSVCTANRISRKALLEYSFFIQNATQNWKENIGRSVDEIFENLTIIGQMYTMDLNDDDSDKLKTIHDVLEKVYGGTYPMYSIMTKLAPKCNDTLIACKWQGHNVECPNIFSTRKSFMGPCCTFNYQRPGVSIMKTQQKFNHTIPRLNKPQSVNSHGYNFGLTFLVDHHLDDYVFTMNAFVGTVVLIHDAYEYPDPDSSGVREKIISPNQEVFVTLHPTLIQGSRSMKTFNVSSRNCVFNDEINLVFSNFYSLSECRLTCRLSNIIETCGCSPPQVTTLFNVPQCSLYDLDCLNRWHIDWYDYTSISDQNSRCEECVPKCNRLQHVVYTSALSFNPAEAKKRSHDPKFMNFSDITNHSIVHVNFGTNKVRNYYQTASYVWYELLANLGSVGCICMGATMVSVIEMIYFFSGKLGAIWIRKLSLNVYRRKLRYEYVN